MTLHKAGEAALIKIAVQNGWITGDVAQELEASSA